MKLTWDNLLLTLATAPNQLFTNKELTAIFKSDVSKVTSLTRIMFDADEVNREQSPHSKAVFYSHKVAA